MPQIYQSVLKKKKLYAITGSFLLILLFSLTLTVVNAAPSFANDRFKTLWQYSDKLVDEVPGAGRGFTWGPNSFGIVTEDYVEGSGGKRQVEYFDKSRMELSSDGSFVTNGLLTKELVTGNRQDGNAKFTQLQPSTVQVAGDDNSGGGNAVSPAYASFKGVVTFNPGENTAQNRTGQQANLAINKAGAVSTLDNPPFPVNLGAYESTLGHNVPQVFIDFQNLTGRIWNGSGYVTAKIYTDNPIANVFGFPISEAYWIRAVVAGQEKDVLVQLFERRVLTYTPANNDPFKVEMGNIGQHYYAWRYGSAAPVTTTPAPTNGVKFLTVQGAAPGSNAYVKVQTAANASCRIGYVTPKGTQSEAAGLVQKNADGNGIAEWTWLIGGNTTRGTGSVTVTCNGLSATSAITIG